MMNSTYTKNSRDDFLSRLVFCVYALKALENKYIFHERNHVFATL